MSTLRSKASGWLPMRLWHRFGIWRGDQKMARIQLMAREAEDLFAEANELYRKHAEPPQMTLPLETPDDK